MKAESYVKKRVLPQFALAVIGLAFAAPFLWILSTSFKATDEVFKFPPTLFPQKIIWDNYVTACTLVPFFRYLFNTGLITVLSIIGQLFAAPMVAYSISLIDWKGKNIIFPLVLATMMIPIQVTMIPVYMIFHKLHLTGSIWPLIIPTFTGAPLYIFLLRQFFMTLPKSLLSAAEIDGASALRIYLQIVLPLCKPALVAVGIFTFLYTWSDFLSPLLYLDKVETYTLSLGLNAFMREHYVEWGPLMAACAMFTVPVVIIFFFAQKQFIEGITLTGIKG
jgi:multiple sugar transport system permease protein